MKAIWNNQIIAESSETIVIESNHYFPRDSIVEAFYLASETTTVCHWKGEAHYYSLSVNGKLNRDAAWFYPKPKEEAKNIEGMVAFWKGVQVIE
ncbi:MAG: DUF427 domain-containing protein [Candidatus Thiodiazotropha sp. DIVDIV]